MGLVLITAVEPKLEPEDSKTEAQAHSSLLLKKLQENAAQGTNKGVKVWQARSGVRSSRNRVVMLLKLKREGKTRRRSSVHI